MVVSTQWTYTLSNSSIIINQSFDMTVLSVLATSGQTIITCSLPKSGILPTPITLKEGQSVTISSDDSNVIDGITISTLGVTSLIGR